MFIKKLLVFASFILSSIIHINIKAQINDLKTESKANNDYGQRLPNDAQRKPSEAQSVIQGPSIRGPEIKGPQITGPNIESLCPECSRKPDAKPSESPFRKYLEDDEDSESSGADKGADEGSEKTEQERLENPDTGRFKDL